ncbi:MAG: cobalamin-dependent protein [Mycobacterium sp.]
MNVREQLWGAVIDCDEYAAVATIYAAMDAGVAPEAVLLDVIAPVQTKIGTDWAANRISIAQEHAATAINDRVIAALAHHPASRTSAHRGTVTVACVDGEWHALPARLLAETLRLRGWQVDFLGAQVPTPHLIAHLHHSGPDAVALSGSIPTRLPTAHAAITACQAAGVAVLAGGAAFGADGRYARQLGADAWAPDARAAAERLAEGFLSTHLSSVRQPIDDLPHLIDQEYTTVSQTSAQLVQETMASLEARIPAMRDYTELQRQRTTEDVASIVDFLVAGLYTDDDALFTGFITWTADILTARGVPAATLFPALDILGKQLHEFPRSQRLLNAALSALAGEKSPATDPN